MTSKKRTRHHSGGAVRCAGLGKARHSGEGLGNREEERAPASGRALDPDTSTVGFDDAPGDGKPEPGSLTSCPGRLPETVKDMRQMLGRNAAPGISNPEDHLRAQ